MVYMEGSKPFNEIIEDIANALIASSPNWSNGDATWDTTTDTTMEMARRCLKYDGLDNPFWLCLVSSNYGRKQHSSGYYFKGLQYIFSSSWDDENHTYAGSSYLWQHSFEGRSGNVRPVQDINGVNIDYVCWVEETGFALMAKSSVADSTDDLQVAMFTCFDIFTPEYDTGNYPVACHGDFNYEGWFNTTAEPGYGAYRVIRPFYLASWDDDGLYFPIDSYYMYQSNGNGKIYSHRPRWHVSDDDHSNIDGVCDKFLRVSTGVGITEGDILTIQGETKKYKYIRWNSLDYTGGYLDYAIRCV